MAHAIWKGAISFGLVTIPVELSAAVTRNEIAFHLLDSRDMAPVRNERVSRGHLKSDVTCLSGCRSQLSFGPSGRPR